MHRASPSPLLRSCLYAFMSALVLLLVATGSPSVRAQNVLAAGAAGPVVELPKFVVTDSRELPPPEAWRYAEIPGFEILTNASDKATKRLIKDFEQFKEALALVWPIPNRSGVPTSLILCGRGGKFDAFVPSGKTSADRALASLFLKNKEQTAIIIDLQSSTLNILATDTTNDAATGTDSSYISVDHDKQLYREYVHFLLSTSEPRLPAWLEEGMAQIIMAMKVDPKYIVFGKLEDPNTISAQAGAVAAMNALMAADDPDGIQIAGAPAEDRDFNAALQRRALVPFPKFFAVTSDSPEAINPLGNNVWAKQSYAFVHMCLYGRGKRYQKPFATFLTRLGKEPVSEELFKECFKMDYKKMLMELRGYIDFCDYQHQEYVLKGEGLGSGKPLVLRDATQSEVGRIKGEALALAGHHVKAKAELIAPYIRGEREPLLLAALGLYDRAHGDEVRGRKFIEAATAAKVTRPRVYLELARYRYADALAKPGAGENFSAEQVSAILAPLLIARVQPPSMPEVYEVMTDVWAQSAETPKRDDVLFLIEGVRFFPGRLRMLYQAAVLSARANMLDVAHAFAEHGVKFAPDPKGKARFEALKASLPPLTPTALDAAAAAKAAGPAPKR
ncbi:MAG: hypothetical protein ACKVVO_19145 [Opitutaceae bacterium]